MGLLQYKIGGGFRLYSKTVPNHESSKSIDNSDPFTTFSFISRFNGLFQCKDVSHISIFVANITNTKPLNSGKETSINSIDGKY